MQWTGSIEFGWLHQWLLICRWILATPHILFALFVLPEYATYTHCTQFSVSQSYRRMAFNVINIAGFAAHTIRNNVIHARAKKQKCEIIFLLINDPRSELGFYTILAVHTIYFVRKCSSELCSFVSCASKYGKKKVCVCEGALSVCVSCATTSSNNGAQFQH